MRRSLRRFHGGPCRRGSPSRHFGSQRRRLRWRRRPDQWATLNGPGSAFSEKGLCLFFYWIILGFSGFPFLGLALVVVAENFPFSQWKIGSRPQKKKKKKEMENRLCELV